MRREFPLWSSVGASCPSITVNSTGAAIAAGTQIGAVPSNAIDWAVAAEQTLARENEPGSDRRAVLTGNLIRLASRQRIGVMLVPDDRLSHAEQGCTSVTCCSELAASCPTRTSGVCTIRPQSKNLVKMLGSNCIQQGQPGSAVSIGHLRLTELRAALQRIVPCDAVTG